MDATCVACTCTDRRACPGGCSWLELDREHGIGLCSQCADRRPAWPEWRKNVIAALAKAGTPRGRALKAAGVRV